MTTGLLKSCWSLAHIRRLKSVLSAKGEVKAALLFPQDSLYMEVVAQFKRESSLLN